MIVAEFAAALGLNIDETSFSRGDRLMGGLKRAVTFFLGVEAVRGLRNMVQGVADVGDAAAKTARKVGISAEAFQEYSYASKLAGADGEQFKIGLEHLARALDELRISTAGPVAQSFRDLGISLDDPAVKAHDLDAILLKLADKFQKMPDDGRKTAIAMNLLGRSGAELIPLLDQGADGIQKAREEARKLGIVMSGKTAHAMEEFNDQQTRVKAAFEGIKVQIVTALLPALKQLVDKTLEWVKSHHEVISSALKAGIAVLIIAFKVLAVAVQGAAAIFDFFSQHADLAQAVLIALGAVITAFAIQAAIDWLIAFWPVPLIILAIIGTIGWVKLLWSLIKKGAHYVAEAWRYLKDKVVDFAEYVFGLQLMIWEKLKGVGEAIKKAFGDAWDWVKKKFDDTVDYISNSWLGKLAKFSFKYSIGGVVYDALKNKNSAPGMTAPSVAGGAANPSSFSVSIGTLSTQVNASTNADPQAIADASSAATKKQIDEAIRHAKQTLTGERP